MATRLRRVFCKSIHVRSGDAVYFEPARTSPQARVCGRISNNAGEPSCRIRSTICIRARDRRMKHIYQSRSDDMRQPQVVQSRSDDMIQPRTQVLGNRAPAQPQSQRDDRFRRGLTLMSLRCNLHSPETEYMGLASQAIACRRFATKSKYWLLTPLKGCAQK